MHVEVQVALNFLISFLYNKLPRRRVNQFGEEMEKMVKQRFAGHWYPESPMKGSGFRCLKTTPPLDLAFGAAAMYCGVNLSDIQENLPKDLSIWIDPGEVSYRLGEKGPVRVLYNKANNCGESQHHKLALPFNPEARCFKPVDRATTQLNQISLDATSSPDNCASMSTFKSNSPVTTLFSQSVAPLTFTTATFAQTKFGSTKPKTVGKRFHRLSPTELNNYIKQWATAQQTHQNSPQQRSSISNPSSLNLEVTSPIFSSAPGPSQKLGSLSPNTELNVIVMTQQSHYPATTAPIQSHLSMSSTRNMPTSTLYENIFGGFENDLDQHPKLNSNANISASISSLNINTTPIHVASQQLVNLPSLNSHFPPFFNKSFFGTGRNTASNHTSFNVQTLREANSNIRDLNSLPMFSPISVTNPNHYQHLLTAT
ncbi:protein Tob1-like [Limulus polyphemus]|uniref:Protein Tob1-like n=1 Tax=Limulus polyphemus TaxID=6850 RepID=A0ABM1S1L3_LIMPO|nr:protein Tob1-like [Limulus polyphemus]XP_022237517.1 protein Tob1-like [Limulus polyphemus]XP_022237518.1 protein Tob1-like [Limulus polyphemus]